MSGPLRWVVTGAGGQLGVEVHGLLAAAGEQVTGLDRRALDVTDAAAVGACLTDLRPDVVVNTAAYTAVDAAETDVDGAAAVNTRAPELLARGARAVGARLLHVSTDYVFDGTSPEPYLPADPTAPVSVYGRTKRDGERAALAAHPDGTHVVRTAWVYGRHGGNFVRTMLRLAAGDGRVEVVADQVGNPTWAAQLAGALVELGRRPDVTPGVHHVAGAGRTSWFDLARAVFSEAGADPARVQPTTSAAYVRPAPRPAFSVLADPDWVRAGLTPLPPWREALTEARVATWT